MTTSGLFDNDVGLFIATSRPRETKLVYIVSHAIPLLLLCVWSWMPATIHALMANPQRSGSITSSQPSEQADCTTPKGNNPGHRYDVVVVGAGIAGLSAAKELQHLQRSVLILEANNRIGGRAYVGYIGDEKVPIDYGGAWIHGIPTNPLTGLVDSMGFKRERTELNLPYFVNNKEASGEEKKVFDHAVEEYEDAVTLAAKSVEDQHALAEFACSEYRATFRGKRFAAIWSAGFRIARVLF